LLNGGKNQQLLSLVLSIMFLSWFLYGFYHGFYHVFIMLEEITDNCRRRKLEYNP